MFGQNCSSKCGDCLGYEQCHHINGTCFNRCDKGFQGEMCTDGILWNKTMTVIYNQQEINLRLECICAIIISQVYMDQAS